MSRTSAEKIKHKLSDKMQVAHTDVLQIALNEVDAGNGAVYVNSKDISNIYAPLDEKLTKPIL